LIPHSACCIGEEERAAVDAVMRSGRIAQGPEVAAFEEECAAFVGRRYGVATNSGTNALHLALGALGVQEAEPVAFSSYACAALATAVRLQGGAIRLCDSGSRYALDPKQVPADARVAIHAHLFGAASALPECPAVVEDIAQSLGGDSGKASKVAVASFYATKLMCTGEGGMVLTDELAIADYARDHRDYDNRDDFGGRCAYKMTDVQAAMGRVQLRRLPEFVARRRELAERYNDGLRGLPLGFQDPDRNIFFRYVLETDQRDALEAHLQEAGVDAKRPVYRPAHHYFGGEFPQAERAHRRCLSLPIYPSLDDTQVAHVIDSVRRFFE
jgi:dTDP-4-amino-4,6-dideoxygalactose transaminase